MYEKTNVKVMETNQITPEQKEKLTPIFLANIMRHSWYGGQPKKLSIVELECIDPTPQFTKGQKVMAMEVETSKNWYYDKPFLAYKIFLPILGPRVYTKKRFKELDRFVITRVGENKFDY